MKIPILSAIPIVKQIVHGIAGGHNGKVAAVGATIAGSGVIIGGLDLSQLSAEIQNIINALTQPATAIGVLVTALAGGGALQNKANENNPLDRFVTVAFVVEAPHDFNDTKHGNQSHQH